MFEAHSKYFKAIATIASLVFGLGFSAFLLSIITKG